MSNKSPQGVSILIAAGGTGGHLYPAVALAREFLRRQASAHIQFVGTTRGIEQKVLAHEKLPLTCIAALPFMGIGLLKALWALCMIPRGVWQSVKVLRAHQTDIVIGVGGYTTPPVLLAATLLNIPRVILEPNAHAGMANKVVGPLAHRIYLAFESAAAAFSGPKTRLVGMPIRQSFLEQVIPSSLAPSEQSHRTLLIFGGSQGAHAINEAVIQALPFLSELQSSVRVVHQTGEADRSRVQEAYTQAGIQADVVPFLYDMPSRLREATLVIARSGAMTLAELTACGKPAILIPLPQAIYNHQLRNAEVLEKAGAAVIIPQAQLTGEELGRQIHQLFSDATRLRSMSERSQALGRRDAGETIVQECLDLIHRV